jgi:large subunit ribosomal protein L23
MKAPRITLRPRISEKAYALSQKTNVHVFEVPTSASRQMVQAAVTEQFKVTVTNVNTATIKGKSKKTYRKGGRSISGRRSDVKKAFVTVKQGELIPIFAAEEKEEKRANTVKKEKK